MRPADAYQTSILMKKVLDANGILMHSLKQRVSNVAEALKPLCAASTIVHKEIVHG
jgi:hypothetical protein